MGDYTVSDWLAQVEASRLKLLDRGIKVAQTIEAEERGHNERIKSKAYHFASQEEQKKLRARANTRSLRR